MKSFRARRAAVLLAAAVLFILALSVSASAAFPLWITRDLEPTVEADVGETVELSVEAVGGFGDVSYQWYGKAGPLDSTSANIRIPVTSEDEVYCVVNCGEQSVESRHCQVKIRRERPRVPVSAPVFTLQPKSMDLSFGQSGVLSAKATCANEGRGVKIVYQWYASPVMDFRYASPLTDGDSSDYIIPGSYTPSKMFYICEAYSTNGVDESERVYSAVADVYCGNLVITKHPTGESVSEGGKATFIAKAEGAAAFQWRIVRNDGTNGFFRADEAPSYINGLQVYGADTDTLVLSNIPASMNGMNIICVFYADAARTRYEISAAALLTVRPKPTPVPTATPYVPKPTVKPTAKPSVLKTVLAPSVSVRPEIAVSEDGRNDSLSILAVDNNSSGTVLRYQWYKNSRNSNSGGTAIAGARSASYFPTESSDGRYYYVGVWATDGTTTSKVVYSEPVLLSAGEPEKSVLLAPSISVRPDVDVAADGRRASLSILAVDNNDEDGVELEFQWYRNTRNSNAGGTAVSSAHYESFNPIILNSSRYYYVAVWATDGERISKTVYSEPVLVSKDSLFDSTLLAPSVSVRPELILSEDGSELSLSVRAVDNNDRSDTELAFQWYRSKVNSVSGGTIIPGAEEAQYTPALPSDYKYYYVAVWASDGVNTSKVAYSGPVLVG